LSYKRRLALALGWITTLPYRAAARRVQIGAGLLGNGRLRIRGPGRTILEAGINAWSHAELNQLVTTRAQARIRIGPNARLNGCTLIAAAAIDVGADCVLGSCFIRDHVPIPGQLDAPARPIVLEDNVWVGGQAAIMPGVRIGKNSVVGIHAVVFDDVPPDVIVAGNPARVVRPVDVRR
jgi:acetyltransferase-like isoleucine patch superfamily enzyme